MKKRGGKKPVPSGAERRRELRADVDVPLKIKKDRNVIEAHTRNLSASGAFCTLDRFVPLNSTLDVTLLVPEAPRKGRPVQKKVRCHGIVVRNTPEGEGAAHPHYGIALFFTDLSASDRERLAALVHGKLHVPPPKGTLASAASEGAGRVFSSRCFGGKGFSVRSANFRVLGDGISLSKNGICFQADRSIPLFREIAVNLVLPPGAKARRGNAHEALQCSAVVVGCEQAADAEKYDMAAYFVGLTKEQKERLDRCIKEIL
jgi:hypothetical protein